MARQAVGRHRKKREMFSGVNIPPVSKSSVKYYFHMNYDPLLPLSWHLRNIGLSGGVKGIDLNVEGAWKLGFSGRGIRIVVVDDGLDYLHPELSSNFDLESSFDYVSFDSYPYPLYNKKLTYGHGTRCAGLIAGEKDNGICGVGVAFHAKIGGIRLIDADSVSDFQEASALSHNWKNVDIYSCSWGPPDGGDIIEAPFDETRAAFLNGVVNGRGGKGVIFVWAGGDGGRWDNCNCDGFASSMFTIAINSATNDGQSAVFDEPCSSIIATTFSSGKIHRAEDQGIATCEVHGDCTTTFSGTSASTPMAAGVLALALEANPSLTWRDMQYLVILTSRRSILHDALDQFQWTKNAAGLEWNPLFGYGILDATAIVQLAKVWTSVPPQEYCLLREFKTPRIINVTHPLLLEVDAENCLNSHQNVSEFHLEHVIANLTIKATKRGALTIYLTSPMNTTSQLLTVRPKDGDDHEGFSGWPFMSLHFWGEKARGKWKLQIVLETDDVLACAVLFDWKLELYGVQSRVI